MTTKDKKIIEATIRFIREKFSGEGTGHDWWHIERVWKNSKLIAKTEKGDSVVIELAALLHDVADWKFNDDEKAGGKATVKWLGSQGLDQNRINQVQYIVDNISYKGGANKHKMQSIEGKIVQDADRLDALGAIGISRVFAYSGHKARPIHDPSSKPKMYKSVSELKKSKHKHTAINHFYEKLLLLKNLMNTKTGKKLATERDQFMRAYLKQFYKEWGKA